MKILIFRTDPSIMNIATYNSQEIGLAKAYIALGHTCDIVYYNGGTPSRVEKIDAGNGKYINLYWRKGFSVLNNGFFPGIGKLLRQYDMIQVSEYYFFASWYVYTFFSKTRKVYVYQGVYDSDNSAKYKLRCKIMDPILLHKRQLANTQVFTKSKLAQESMEKRGFQNVKTVGVGLDLGRLEQEPVCSPWVLNLAQKKGNTKYLLYVGVLEDRRNILFLLDVLNHVISKMPDTKLVLVGRGKREYTEQVFNKIRDMKLGEHILYKEALPQSELAKLYNIADVFLLPTKYEIFGMVLMEAITFGLPVISSYNGGSSTVIRPGENGDIVKDFDVEEWADNVLKWFEDSSIHDSADTADEIDAAAFSWSSIARTILDVMVDEAK